MRVLGESWCFCNGGGKSERTKAAIFSSKAPAMARINGGGIGFLIHRNLLLTTHANLPSVAAAEAAEIRLQNGLSATLFPHRFFITSSVLDLTMVGLDALDGEVQQPHYLKTCSKPNLELGSVVYLLGQTDKNELTVGEGKVVIATDNLIKLSTDGVCWSPGSAGFDLHGNLAFMVCDPMKLATSPNTKSSSTSSSSTSSWKKDHLPMQFGIPIPIIRHWLHQHWEGNLDELNKPKLPLMRLMLSTTGPKSENSCASFTMRQVFKPIEGQNEESTPISTNVVSVPRELPGPSSHTTLEQKTICDDVAHVPGIPTPEIYESRMLNSVPVRKDATAQIQLLDINFPPRIAKAASPLPKQSKCDQEGEEPSRQMVDAESTGSVNGLTSEEGPSSCSPVDMHEYSSEGETTMYSAETAESRNYPSPREGRRFVGRSQSCVNYHNRWGPLHRNASRGAVMEKHRSFLQGRKVYSQGGATSQRSKDYFSPTVSSIMKKHNSEQQSSRPRQSGVNTSPRWMF